MVEDAADEPLLPHENSVRARSDANHNVWQRALSRLICSFRFIYENGVAHILCSQAIAAFQGIYYRLLIQKGLPTFQIFFALSTCCYTCALILVLLTLNRSKLSISRGMWVLVFLGGVFGNFMGISLYTSINLIPLGNAMALSRLAPIMAVFLGYLFGWEHLNLQILGGVALCSAGAIVIEHPPFLFGGSSSWRKSDTFGSILAFCSSIFLALFTLITARIGSRIETQLYLFWFHLVGISVTFVPLAIEIPSPPVFSLPWDTWLLLLGFCMLTVVKNFINTQGFQLCNAALSSSLTTLSVVFSFITGYFFSGEGISIFSVTGTIALISGIITVATGKQKVQRELEFIEHRET